jgi:hypothetical protein
MSTGIPFYHLIATSIPVYHFISIDIPFYHYILSIPQFPKWRTFEAEKSYVVTSFAQHKKLTRQGMIGSVEFWQCNGL